MSGWEKYLMKMETESWKKQKAGKIEMKTKTVARDKEGPYIMLMRSIQEHRTSVHTYTKQIFNRLHKANIDRLHKANINRQEGRNRQ